MSREKTHTDKLLGGRIRTARKSIGLTQEKLAEFLELTKQTVNRYELGYRVPDADVINRMATRFGCNHGWLISGKGDIHNELEEMKGKGASRSIPLFSGKIPAGFPNMGSDEIEEYISLPDAPAGSCAMRVVGDSMSPTIRSGDYVIILPDGEVRPGDIVIASDAYGDVMMKRYQIKEDEALFVSDNPEYPITKAEGHTVIGKVISAWSKRMLSGI